jgi:spermidine synthase
MSRGEEPYFSELFNKLAFLQPTTVLEVGFGLGISAELIQQHLRPAFHDIVELDVGIFQDLKTFARGKQGVRSILGDWDTFKPEKQYDFIFFDTYDYFPANCSVEVARAQKAKRARQLLTSNGVFCHPHFGDGDIPDLPGFETVVVERLQVPEFSVADGSKCEHVAIAYHRPNLLENFR